MKEQGTDGSTLYICLSCLNESNLQHYLLLGVCIVAYLPLNARNSPRLLIALLEEDRNAHSLCISS